MGEPQELPHELRDRPFLPPLSLLYAPQWQPGSFHEEYGVSGVLGLKQKGATSASSIPPRFKGVSFRRLVTSEFPRGLLRQGKSLEPCVKQKSLSLQDILSTFGRV
jgi:hypothetical protein